LGKQPTTSPQNQPPENSGMGQTGKNRSVWGGQPNLVRQKRPTVTGGAGQKKGAVAIYWEVMCVTKEEKSGQKNCHDRKSGHKH